MLLFLLFRFDVDLGELWDIIRNANPLMYAGAVAVYYAAFILRGLRWRLLVENIGVDPVKGERVPSVLHCSEAILLGWFANSVTWFRLGDAYRGYLINQASGVGFAKGLGTVLAERIVDVFVMFGLLALTAIAFIGAKSSGEAKVVLLAALGLFVAAIVLALVMKLYGHRLARFLPDKVQSWYAHFHHGTLGSLRRWPLLIIVSILVWVVDSSRLLLVIYALNVQDTIPLSMPVFLGFVLFAALAHSFLTTIPITPGGLGFVEAGLTGILAIEMARGDALAVALVERSITYASIIVFGAIVLLTRELRRRRAITASSGASPG